MKYSLSDLLKENINNSLESPNNTYSMQNVSMEEEYNSGI